MGGYTSEFDISIKSGNRVYAQVMQNHDAYKVIIKKEEWTAIDCNNNCFKIDKSDFSVIDGNRKIHFDAAFNVIHGAPGEDGQLIAYLELLGIPHSSAPFYQMALTFNKKDCLAVAKKYGIQTANSIYLKKGDHIDEEKIIETVGLPCFVKPNKSGSSFGISKVHEAENLKHAIATAYKEDEEILIESFLDGKEFSIGVVQYQGKTVVLPITEIISENDFFDYEAKYLGKSKEITPAVLDETLKTELEKTAIHLYRSLNMSGFSRSEFILVNKTPYFLEMNTVPGMTAQSILPQQSDKAGIPVEALLEDTIKRITVNKKL